MKYISIVIAVIGVIVVMAFLVRRDAPTVPVETPPAVVPAHTSLGTAPETNIQNPDGTDVSFTSVITRNSVVNSWASWCPFCVKELADFADVASARAGEVDFLIVNRGESIAKGAAFLADLGLASTSMRIFYDEDQSLYQALGGFSMPETVFIDADGTILFHKRGPMTKSELEQVLNSLGW